LVSGLKSVSASLLRNVVAPAALLLLAATHSDLPLQFLRRPAVPQTRPSLTGASPGCYKD